MGVIDRIRGNRDSVPHKSSSSTAEANPSPELIAGRELEAVVEKEVLATRMNELGVYMSPELIYDLMSKSKPATRREWYSRRFDEVTNVLKMIANAFRLSRLNYGDVKKLPPSAQLVNFFGEGALRKIQKFFLGVKAVSADELLSLINDPDRPEMAKALIDLFDIRREGVTITIPCTIGDKLNHALLRGESQTEQLFIWTNGQVLDIGVGQLGHPRPDSDRRNGTKDSQYLRYSLIDWGTLVFSDLILMFEDALSEVNKTRLNQGKQSVQEWRTSNVRQAFELLLALSLKEDQMGNVLPMHEIFMEIQAKEKVINYLFSPNKYPLIFTMMMMFDLSVEELTKLFDGLEKHPDVIRHTGMMRKGVIGNRNDSDYRKLVAQIVLDRMSEGGSLRGADMVTGIYSQLLEKFPDLANIPKLNIPPRHLFDIYPVQFAKILETTDQALKKVFELQTLAADGVQQVTNAQIELLKKEINFQVEMIRGQQDYLQQHQADYLGMSSERYAVRLDTLAGHGNISDDRVNEARSRISEGDYADVKFGQPIGGKTGGGIQFGDKI